MFKKLTIIFCEIVSKMNPFRRKSINLLDIHLNKNFDELSPKEAEMIKDSITIDCTEGFKAARKKYINPYKDIIYDYPEIKSLDENTRDNILNDLYYNMEDGWKKNFEYINIMEKYSTIDSETLSYILTYEHKRFAFLMHRYDYEGMNVFWYLWDAPESCPMDSIHHVLNKVLVYFDNPPSPEIYSGKATGSHYHAGVLPYCHCFASPVMDMYYIFNRKKYVKLYWNNEIIKLTKEELKQFITDNNLHSIPEIPLRDNK